MEKIKGLLAKINMKDLSNSAIFGFGFLVGTGDVAGALFFSVFWYIGAFIGRKMADVWFPS